jgi:hypothetical protein
MLTARAFIVLRTLALLLAAMLPAVARGAAGVHHEMTVALDPLARQLHVSDRIRINPQQELVLRLDARFVFEHILVQGRPVAASKQRRAAAEFWQLHVRAPDNETVVIDVRYSGQLDMLNTALDHRQVLELTRPVAGAEGAFVSAATPWYLHDATTLVTYR